MAKKRIQITSGVHSQTEYSYQRVHNLGTGEITTVEHTAPHSSSSTVTVTTNPYTVETDGSTDATKTKGGSSSSVHINKPGYDTSQL
jgi:hypothetical protein